MEALKALKQELDDQRVQLRKALARAYCAHPNTTKVLDSDLIEAMANEILRLPSRPNLGCATTGELLEEIKARIELDGQLGYRTVDGDI
jgi:hypothetical protein